MCTSLGERLTLERGLVNLGVAEFGVLCGVSKGSQINYEKSRRSPDSEYLEKAHKLGVDINYVVTGMKTLLLGDVLAVTELLNVFIFDNHINIDPSVRTKILEGALDIKQSLGKGNDLSRDHLIPLFKATGTSF